MPEATQRKRLGKDAAEPALGVVPGDGAAEAHAPAAVPRGAAAMPDARRLRAQGMKRKPHGTWRKP